MAESIQDFQTEFRKNTVVQDVSVETEAALGFDLGAEIIGALTITFLLQSYVGVLLGKFADATWDTIKRYVDQLNKNAGLLSKPSQEGVIRAVYRSEVKSAEIELVIEYASIRDLKRDLKNHRQYIALGLGYANAKLPGKSTDISLLSCLPSENQGHVLELKMRRTSSDQRTNQR
jgi:hypothetical protein